MAEPRSILITGASSGIGEALALAYAGSGTSLALSGRDPERIEAVRAACAAKGAAARARLLDVTDAAAMAAWLAYEETTAAPDLIIANAGISAGTGGGGESAEQAREIIAVNVDGVLNTVLPAIEHMKARRPDAQGRRGQIAIMSSLAAFRGFPGAPAYCASKAAVRVWGEALRGECHRYGIAVSVICPGYVRSRMTEKNRFRMPFLMDAERAASIIRRGLERDRPRIAFPWPMSALIWWLSALPPAATDRMMRRLPKKE
jgi:short-subunit dehydrogenase